MSILISNIAYLIRETDRVETDVDILVEGNTVKSIGHNLRAEAGDNVEVVDASNCVVMPGFVNAHTHLYQNFIKGVSPDFSLIPWINAALFPTASAVREGFAKGDGKPAYYWSAIAAMEMIRSGITCCLNMDLTHDQVMVAWRDVGLRGIGAYTLVNKNIPDTIRRTDDELHREVMTFFEKWHDPDGLLKVFFAPSTPFLCDEGLLTWVRDQAEALDVGVQIHVAEDAGETEESLKEWGLTPIERLDRLGLLNPRMSAVHCVHINDADIKLMAESGVAMVHCPKSNMKLADGIAPVVALKEAGVSVSVATDGSASNDLLDMWEEMRSAVLLARVANNDAAALTTQDVFRMVTTEPAKVCQINAGKLDPGCLADLAVVELDSVHLRPFHEDHLINQLVFCGKSCDVRDTMINGAFVMRDRKIVNLDEEAILQKAEEIEAPLYKRRDHFKFN